MFHNMKALALMFAAVLLLTFVPVSNAAASAQDALNEIDINSIVGNTQSVTEDFVLPLTDSSGQVALTWSSDDTDALKIYGENAILVSNPRERKVHLTVTAVSGNDTQSESYELVIAPAEYTGDYLINEDFSGIDEGHLPDDGKWARDLNYTEEQINVQSNGEWISFMGATQFQDESVLRVFRDSDFKPADKLIHSVYACFGEIDQDAEIIITMDQMIDHITHDGMAPRLTTNSTNVLGSAFTTYIPVSGSGGSPNQMVIAGQRIPLVLGQWSSAALKAKMSSSADAGVPFDAYYDSYFFKNARSAVKASYFQNMMFGVDTNLSKEINMYIDNVKVFINGAEQIIRNFDYVDIGATPEGNVIGNLDFSTEFPGAAIQYYCSVPGVIEGDGTVHHPANTEDNMKVQLCVVAEKDGYRSFKELELSIIANDEVTDAFLNMDIEDIIGDGQSVDAVKTSFELPQLLLDTYPLRWTSSDDTVIRISNNQNAEVIRNIDNKDVTLTVSLTNNGITLTNKFDLTVSAVESSIDIDEILGQDINAVTKDFLLPEMTEDGESITWSTSDESSLFLFEDKAYILPGIEPKTVMLGAEGVFAGVQSKLDYELTLAPIKAENDILVDEDFENVELGTLPNTKIKDGRGMWALDNSITAGDPNLYNTVVEEGSVLTTENPPLLEPDKNPNNRVLQAGKNEKDSSFGLVHLRFDAPMETVVNLEFDVYAEAPEYGHIWLCNNMDATLNGDLLRLPMMSKGLIISDINGNNKRFTYPDNTWHRVRFIVDTSNHKYDCYIDGKLEMKDGDTKNNGNILSRISYGFGKGLKGYNLVDNVTVWIDVYRSVGAYANSIELGDLSAVTDNIKLPALTPCGDADITWLSTDPTTLNEEGRVICPAANEPDKAVTLYALIQKNNIRALRKFDVTVKSEKNDEESVAEDFAGLNLDTEGFLTKDLVLLQKGLHGSDIIWESSHPEILDPKTGKLTRKPFDNMQITEVTLTAVVKKGSVTSEKKSFTFRVPEHNYALNGTAAGSSDRIDTPYKNVIDNNPNTFWSPKTTDEEKYLIITMPNATATTTKINKLFIQGEYDGVTVSYSTGTSGDQFTKIAYSGDTDIAPAINAKRLKFEFSGGDIKISDIGVYFVANDNILAQEDADAVILENLRNVTKDLVLPAVGEKNQSKIIWQSDAPDIISNSGKLLKRPSKSTQVKLTMTVIYGEASVTKTFEAYVPGDGSGGNPSGGGSFGGGSGGGSNISYPTEPAAPTVTPDEENVVFSDLGGYDWAKSYIEGFTEKGIISGVGDGKFEPGRAVTRAEFLKILLSAFDIPVTTGNTVNFADVRMEHWYYDVVSAGVAAGIVHGVSETEFLPEQTVSRQDMAVMLSKALHYQGKHLPEGNGSFVDAGDIAPYAVPAVNELTNAGIIHGYDDGTYKPYASATRAEAVVLVGRAAE